jgi:outer membrane protein assembly factor BamE (lipoprotein component of BamABCDE complex)
MKQILLIALVLGLAGCTYTNEMKTGTPFDSYKVVQIQKGKTTEQNLVTMFGQPTTKAVLNEHDMKWIYSYTDGSASAQMFTAKTTSNFTMHMLDILIRDGVVINYAETNSPINTTLNSKTSL